MDDLNKKINITGLNNRYQIKKLIQKKEEKKRVICNNWNLSSDFFDSKKQIELLDSLNNKNIIFSNETDILTYEVERKISSYRQQDIEKKRDISFLISFNQVINKLINSQLKCYYCSCEIFILYEMARENKQWTLDRIDNNKGHINDNVIIACLKCNLKRKTISKDAFLFTKQLTITKLE